MKPPTFDAIRANVILFALSTIATESVFLLLLVLGGRPELIAAMPMRIALLCLSGALWCFAKHKARLAFVDAQRHGHIVWHRDRRRAQSCISEDCRAGWLVQLHIEGTAVHKTHSAVAPRSV